MEQTNNPDVKEADIKQNCNCMALSCNGSWTKSRNTGECQMMKIFTDSPSTVTSNLILYLNAALLT